MVPSDLFTGRPKPKLESVMELDTILNGSGPTDPMSTTLDYAGSSTTKVLKGTTVGLLDDSQKSRVLSAPGSVLSFASFHPRTASGQQGLNLPGGEESIRARRIVIETLLTGGVFWRWVPRARGVDTVRDEGSWPRTVLLCGELVLMSQEQWDIYKLDPYYDCYVPPGRETAAITLKVQQKKREDHTASSNSSRSSSVGLSKRSLSASDTEPEDSIYPAKKQPRRAYVESDEEEEEVAEIVGGRSSSGPAFHKRVKLRRTNLKQNRMDRWEKIFARTSRHTSVGIEDDLIDLTMDDATDLPPFLSKSKRALEDDTPPPKRAKVRQRSPTSIHGDLASKRQSRHKDRMNAYQRKKQALRQHKEQIFLEELIASSQSSWSSEPSQSTHPNNSSHPHDEEDPVSLDEKIKRVREMNEREHRNRKAEESVRARAEESERRKAQEAARKKQEEEERIRAQKAKRRVHREHPSWAYGPWTHQRALEKYRLVAEFFDTAKFSAGDPITFEDIPWPVLFKPGTYGPQDVEWSAVEAFFETIRPHMRTQDYKSFVQASHRRFHPDRWRARRVWEGLRDEELREALEVAANTVAQALTPIWMEVKCQ